MEGPSTPIRGMSSPEAMRALGPAIVKLRGAEAELPKTIELAREVSDQLMTILVRNYMVGYNNVSLILEQIAQTSDDETIQRINADITGG